MIALRQRAASGDLLNLVALDSTGVFVTTEGALGRIVEVTPCNPRVMGEAECERVGRGFWQICTRLAPGQTIQFYVEGVPEELDAAIGESREEVDRQLAQQSPEFVVGLDRLARAHEASLRANARDGSVVRFRAYVVVPYLPDKPGKKVQWNAFLEGRKGLPTASLSRMASAHRRDVGDLQRLTDNVIGDLGALDLGARMLDGVDVWDLLYRRFNPTSAERGPRKRVQIVGSLDEIDDARAAVGAAHALRERIAESPVDDSDGRVIGVEGCLERCLYVSSPPQATHFGWLQSAMEIDKPFVLSVHVEAVDPAKERVRMRRSHRQTWGMIRGLEARHRPPDLDLTEKYDELGDVLRRASGGAGERLLRMSIYQCVREPGPDPDRDEVMDGADRAAKAMAAETEARTNFAAWNQLAVWQSCLPLGRNVAGLVKGVKRRYISTDVGNSVPLVGPSCGSPEGLITFESAGVRQLERFNPWDPMFTNHLMLATGQQGSGKTTWAITTAARLLPYGVHVTVLDRSGHYELLTRVTPGAAYLSIGGPKASAQICPWDVPDARRPSPEKVRFLRKLHELLMGGEFTDDETSLMGEAIRGTYAHCVRADEIPRERYLKLELERMVREASNASDVPILESLARRLKRYVGDGEDAFLLDWPTTVPRDAPLVVFDTRHAGEHLAAVVLIVMERTIAEHERRAAERVGGPPRLFPGDAFISDETWSVFQNDIAGGSYHDLSRRARHLKYGLFLLLLTQYLTDLDNEHGRALMDSAHMRVFFRQSKDQLEAMRESVGLSRNEVEQISRLQTVKGQFASAFWMNASRGRGVVRSVLTRRDVEYWLATSEPTTDVPMREAMIVEMRERMPDASDADVVWAALEELAAIGGAG